MASELRKLLLDLNAPVCSCLPEFGRAGEGAITMDDGLRLNYLNSMLVKGADMSRKHSPLSTKEPWDLVAEGYTETTM